MPGAQGVKTTFTYQAFHGNLMRNQLRQIHGFIYSNMEILNYSWWAVAISLLFGISLAIPVQEVSKRVVSELPRLVIYFQTTHDAATGNPISMLPLIEEKGIALTHLIVCSFHVSSTSELHLNDYPPDDPRFYTLWNETVIMREAGVTVMGMIGGAAAGSFSTATLDAPDDATFELHYAEVYDVVRTYGLQGMDLDVEQSMSQSGIARLVGRLHADFGDDFTITLAPVASALWGGGNLSGFSYATLEEDAVATTATGAEMVDFLNAQFYSGFGTMATPADFEQIVDGSGWDPARIVAGQLTAASNGYGYTSIPTLNETVMELVDRYGTIGGIMGWEYFNSDPAGTAAPWEWAQEMTQILRPDDGLELTITSETAHALDAAWEESAVQPDPDAAEPEKKKEEKYVKVDYFAMVNA